MSDENGFTRDQQSYLQGFTLGTDVSRAVRGLPVLSGSARADRGANAHGATIQIGPPCAPAEPLPAGPEAIHIEAQNRFLAAGRKLCAEEKAKREKNPLDMWDQMRASAARREFPKGTDVFLYKFHGLFHVAPAQDSFMCRLRLPGGAMRSHQLRCVADLAGTYGGGCVDITTRANLQIREIEAGDALHVLTGLEECGIVNRGAGADNIRNVTASATSGFDRRELIETLPLARELHHSILHHRELYGLPRKFNIAFDGGGAVSSLEDTNDIGFAAALVSEEHASPEVPAGVYFQLGLGGITGHGDFARPAGVLVRPDECVQVAAAIVRVFIAHGDRTDRKKARLKYLLDAWGLERFLAETEKLLSFPLRRFPLERCVPRPPPDRQAHVGFHPQSEAGFYYVGVVLPVGRLSVAQARALADIADRFGRGEVRLTVWQNLLIPHIAEDDIDGVKHALEAIGLDWRATSVRAGLVACTGNTGCRYSASNTKGQAMLIASYLEERVRLDQPVNIHLTGCHHSCAQHYVGDIGLLATTVEAGDDLVEGYHVHLGGGYGRDRCLAREMFASVAFDDVPPLLERILAVYLGRRDGPEESFVSFAGRHTRDEWKQMVERCEPAR